MRAVRIHQFGSADVMQVEDVAMPTPKPNHTGIELGGGNSVSINPAKPNTSTACTA